VFWSATEFDDGESSVLIGMTSRARRRGGKWGMLSVGDSQGLGHLFIGLKRREAGGLGEELTTGE
jgi:hypothetical protein